MVSVELILNRLSMVSLITAGIVFIYEGAKYFNMKKQNPDIPEKIYVAAIMCIVVGVIEIVFGIGHLWF